VNLKAMPVAKLMDLKARVESALGAKVAERRRTLQSDIARLARFGGGSGRERIGARGPVPPKYRNPENPSETSAGRGLKPHWLTAALKSGKRLEHFAIAVSAKASVKRTPRKTRGARKAGKK
jgi:DNA-binding protein H-NS